MFFVGADGEGSQGQENGYCQGHELSHCASFPRRRQGGIDMYLKMAHFLFFYS